MTHKLTALISMFALATAVLPGRGLAQTRVYGGNTYQTFSSAGTTNGAASDGANLRLYSSVGQPMAISSVITATSQTQAGILSAVSNGLLVMDATAPTITHTSPAFVSDGTTLSVSIDDGSGVGVDPVKNFIYYKPLIAPAAPANAFTKTSLTAPALGNNFAVNVASAWHDAMGVEYYFQAADKKGNTTSNPTHYYAPLLTASVPLGSLLPFGSAKEGYRLISFPYDLPSPQNSLSNIFSDNSLKKTSTGRMYQFNTTIQKNEEYNDGKFTTIKRGVGYWLLLKTQSNLSLINVTSPSENRTKLYTIDLDPQWNLIGNPYPVKINWDDVMNYSGNSAVASSLTKISTYDGTPWKNPSLLQPFEGAYVKNTSGSKITVTIPFAGQTAPGGRVEKFVMPTSQDISSDAWIVPMTASQNGANVLLTSGGFGMHPRANTGEDWYDNYNPPSLFENAEFKFSWSAFPRLSLSTDMVPTATDFSWDFEIAGGGENEIELSWPSILSGGHQLFLYDARQITLTDMTETNRYLFKPSVSNTFKIYFGQNILNTIRPPQLGIGNPYPNPIANDNSATFNLALPDSREAYQVLLQMYSSTGALIGSKQVELEAGLHQLKYIFDSENTGRGICFYRLSTASNGVSQTSTGKIVMP